MRQITTLVFFATAAIVFFTSISGWGLQNPDEPRYAQVAREMLETGNYALPHINGEIYPDKPPFFFWMIAGASLPFGDVNAFSARFPAALFGYLLIVLTYFFARKIFDPLTGLLAAVILFSFEGFLTTALSVHFDSILAFFTTASFFCFYCGYSAKKNRGWFVLSWLFVGLAVSTKGPVGLAIPLVSIFTFLLCYKDFKTLKRFSVGTGLLIVATTVACWLVPACIAGGEDYTNNILLKQTFGRIVKSYAHEKPFYYYLYKFPFHIMPWSLFVPGACYYFWKKRKKIPEIRFPLIWFAASFVFLSMVSCKRGLYLLPLYPAAAMLLAKFWSDSMFLELRGNATLQKKTVMLPAIFIFGIFTLAGIGLTIASVFTMAFAGIPQPSQIFLSCASGILCLLGIAGIVMLLSRFRIRSTFILTSCAMLTLIICTVACVYPSFDKSKSAQSFAQRINSIVGAEDTLTSFFKPDLFNYYLQRYPIKHVENGETFLKGFKPHEKAYLLLLKKQYMQASENFKNNIVILDRETIGHRTYFLAANKEDCNTG